MNVADLHDLVLGQVADLAWRRRRRRPSTIWYALVVPIAVDVGQRDVQPLVAGKVDACDASHRSLSFL